MKKKTKPLSLIATLSIAVMALAGCTNASEQGSSGSTSTGSTSQASFDPSTVTADSALVDRVPATIKDRGTLIVGSDTSYEPAEFLDKSTQKPVGYDVDLSKALAAVLGLKADIQTAEFTGILPALGAKYDVGISSFTITPERLNSVNMVSYFSAGSAWAVQVGNPQNIDPKDICGKSVGVQTGTTQEEELAALTQECTSSGKDAIDVVSLPKQTDITTRLANNQLAAMSADSPVIANAIAKTNGQLEKVGETTDVAEQGITVAKSDTELAQLIKDALDKLKQDGSYAQILNSWEVSESGIDTFAVNPPAS